HAAVPVGCRGEGVAAVRPHLQGADAGDGSAVAGGIVVATHLEAGHGDAVAIGVAVVAEHVAADRHILVGDGAVIGGQRRRVGHRPGEGLGTAVAHRVGDGDGDGVAAAAAPLAGGVVECPL